MYINVLEGLHFFIPAVRISPPPWLHFSRADESGQTIFLVGLRTSPFHSTINSNQPSHATHNNNNTTTTKNEHHIPPPHRAPSGQSSHHRTQQQPFNQTQPARKRPTVLLLINLNLHSNGTRKNKTKTNNKINTTNPTQHPNLKPPSPTTPPPPDLQRLDRLVSRRRHAFAARL